MTRIDTVRRSERAVIVGTGVAGLSTALALGNCLVVTKTDLGEGSTRWAQGGIAAALGSDDSPRLHAADTTRVAGKIADRAVAELVTAAAPDRIDWLVRLGARFDRTAAGELALGREAGHSRRRIVHASGDATGAELIAVLRKAVLERDDIEVLTGLSMIDLLRDCGRIVGILGESTAGERIALLAPAVVLATGGIGRTYERTTNPVEVTGDGLAAAARAGATLADLEFVQFHPTALDAGLDPMPLLTEALRGEGAHLIDDEGNRFMIGIDPAAELAPRDVVARAIWDVLESGRKAFLDATTAVGDRFPERFPTVWGYALDAGYDPRRDPMPVSPAAHYHMGGIAVDRRGASSLPGLWACGEASSSGLHGANRLASNSLLEGLVFGASVADSIRAAGLPVPGNEFVAPEDVPDDVGDPAGVIADLRAVMWADAGVVRTRAQLVRARAAFDSSAPYAAQGVAGRTMSTVGRLVVDAALRRNESRGGHYRADHPASDPAWQQRSYVTPDPVPAERQSIRG